VVGEGPNDLVFIPGYVSNVELQWEHPAMASFYWRLASFSRLIVFDKRGTGLSDRVLGNQIPTLEERMDDVRIVMDAAESERATLFGISEGGPLALLFAASHPERVERLVLGNSYAHRFRDDIPELAEFAREHWGSGASFKALTPSWTDPEDRRFLARYERLSATPDVAAELLRLCGDIDVRAVLPTITAPTRVVHRKDDDIVALSYAEELAAKIPGAELVVLDGQDHLVYVNPKPILDAVEEFVTGARPVAPAVSERVLTTVLFADVVESTTAAERLGDRAWTDVLARFYEVARSEADQHRGVIVSTTGDGLLATFDGPARAVRFGRALHASVAGLGLSLRVGVHTAEVERLGDDIAGVGVHIASRVTEAAAPGEVWVTRTVRDLVAGAGLDFESRGAHRFKGISEPWELLAAG
jgi:class 3 adenylate cyclase